MSEEEMKALVEMNNMLKHENEKLKQDKQELKNKLDRLEQYANQRSYFDDSRYCCEVQVDLKHILNNEKLNSE